MVTAAVFSKDLYIRMYIFIPDENTTCGDIFPKMYQVYNHGNLELEE